jgi:hypothetical protein
MRISFLLDELFVVVVVGGTIDRHHRSLFIRHISMKSSEIDPSSMIQHSEHGSIDAHYEKEKKRKNFTRQS